jgi:hypothetical protein
VSRYIFDLIEQGEHQNQDFKFEISDSKKIAKTVSAFANTDGGRLLVGVKDNGKIAGVRSDEEYHMIEAAAQLYCKPEVRFDVQNHMVHGKTVMEISIEEQPSIKPVLAKNDEGKWDAYIRVKDENFLASSVIRKIWAQQNSDEAVFLTYTDHERELLSYIGSHDSITVSRYIRLSQLPRREAEKIIVDLVLLDILIYEVSEKGTHFRFNPYFDLDEYENNQY